MGKLDDKIAVVTGGAMGMGFGSAVVMAGEGATVAMVDVSEKVMQSAGNLQKEGFNVTGYIVDVTDKNAVNDVFKQVCDKFGKIDILVNAAGIGIIEPFLEMSDETRDRVFDVNIKGIWNCCKAAIPYMVEADYGKIVNFSSVTGTMVADAGEAAYAASKAAIWGLTKALAMEFAEKNITVNAVCPGYILTPMVMGAAKEFMPENPQAVIDGIAAGIPLGRLGTIEEAGNLVAFLASDESRYITGTQVVFDGASTLPETKVLNE